MTEPATAVRSTRRERVHRLFAWLASAGLRKVDEQPATSVRPLRWWHRWFPQYSSVWDHCPKSPDGQHETREVNAIVAGGVETYQECIHCGRFW